MPARFREEVLNVLLAELLNERGVVSLPEQIKQQRERRTLPDVLVLFQGLRTVIEGKIHDSHDNERQVIDDARDRVDSGVAHMAIAVLYPPSLRRASSLEEAKVQLSRATLRIAVFSEASSRGWVDAGVDYLADLLRRTFDELVAEDVVVKAVELIEAGIEGFAHAITTTPASVDRAGLILGIGEPCAVTP